ncbi:hypothetical protein SIPHO068v1_p0068 [Vibrio phage 51E28.4]|nr:hypothetical protein SIPHO068v1_p0068 [Vibrio phage 51E28.4]
MPYARAGCNVGRTEDTEQTPLASDQKQLEREMEANPHLV